MIDPQHDDHIRRRHAFRSGWLGIASRPNMSRPEPIAYLDLGKPSNPTWSELTPNEVYYQQRGETQ